MPTAGYSGTPLPKKLGIRDDAKVLLVQSPADFGRALGELPRGVEVKRALRGKLAFDVILLFVRKAGDLEKRFPVLAERLVPNGGLWVAWPKKASGVATDLSDGVVRKTGLAGGLVDNKVCAVDETWSGLRFVYRLEDRPR